MAEVRREKLRCFLKTLRRRLASHMGRRISQEEIAAAAGVSRGWYVSLESGKPIRCSVSFLARVAAALNATPPERATLFRLAIPELNHSLVPTVE
jgi:transcriptional regulator with XRE-family HTH domain